MKKIIVLLIGVIAITLFSGCGQVNISCGIESGNVAAISMYVDVPKVSLSEEEEEMFRDDLTRLYYYWDGKGWDVDFNEDDEQFAFYVDMRETGTDLHDAFDKLIEMMSKEISPFSSVEGGYSPSFFSDIYTVTAQLDFTKMVDYDYIDTLVPSQKARILDAIDSIKGTILFNFPGETLDYIGTMDGGNVTVDFTTHEVIDISQTMRVPNQINKLNYDSMLMSLGVAEQNLKTTYYILAGLALLFIVTSVYVIVLSVRRKKQKKAENVEIQNTK